MASFRTGLSEGWGLVKPYFVSEEKWAAIGLLVTVIVLNLILTWLNVVFTFWFRDFYNAIQVKNAHRFVYLLIAPEFPHVFPYIIPGYVEYSAIFTVVAVYALYFQQMLQIKWRQWMTRDFSARWLADRAYYNISLAKSGSAGVDNPDQRISDDLNSFCTNTLALGLDLISNLVTLFSFIAVLYDISGSITIFGITIPGYMLWLAIIYSLAGTWVTQKIGRRLISLNFNQQRVEANFRYSLIRVRDNTEAIALSGGEQDELVSLRDRFADVRENWWLIMRRTKLLGFFTNTFSSVAGNFALIAAAPRFFAGAIQLGDLQQIASVFSSVQGALSWIVTSYTDLVTLRATVSRLHGFKEAVTAARLASAAGPQVKHEGDALNLQHLTLTLPDGRKLLENASLTLPPGEPVLLSGASGSGKSTLFRAIAGIWPHGAGHVARPQGSALFLPQKPYFPLGTLKRAITYPQPETSISDAQATEALAAVRLDHLNPRLHDIENWGQILSGGEQQRLAITRALIAKPDWLFLDEATAALDPALAKQVQTTLRQNLPNATIVSISHHDTAAPGERHLALAGGVLEPVG